MERKSRLKDKDKERDKEDVGCLRRMALELASQVVEDSNSGLQNFTQLPPPNNNQFTPRAILRPAMARSYLLVLKTRYRSSYRSSCNELESCSSTSLSLSYLVVAYPSVVDHPQQ